MSERFYRPALDVVRFCAFFLVFLHHVLPPDGRTPALSAVGASCGLGLCLFFSLSSYLITLLLLREQDATGTVNLRSFYQRRMLRIWPLYFATLLAGIMLAALMRHSLHHSYKTWFIAALLMGGNLVYPAFPLIRHVWSISLEEQFYAFWPVTVKRRAPFAVACVLIVVANVVLIYLGHIHADIETHVWTNSFVQAEMFGGGILLALAERRFTFPASKLLGILSVVAAAPLWFVAARYFGVKGHPANAIGPLSLVLGYGFVAIGCVLIISGFSQFHSWPKPLLYLGKISYGLYIFHFPILAVLTLWAAKRSIHPLLADVVAFVLTVIAAALSYRFFESPFLRWKSRLEIIQSRPV